MEKVIINGKEYELSPLRCKHLRKITKMLAEGSTAGGFSDIDRWMPFIADSIQLTTPDFKAEELDELSLQEFTDTWEKLVNISGVKLIRGEVKPVQTSTGANSTEGSVPESVATPTVN